MLHARVFFCTSLESSCLVSSSSRTRRYCLLITQIKIIIANEYIKRDNPEVLKRNLYGSDTFTSNSDCVCMGIHSGFLNFNNANKKNEGYELSCKVVKPKKNYTGCLKNNFLSRSIKGYNGNALKPESVRALTSLGPMENL